MVVMLSQILASPYQQFCTVVWNSFPYSLDTQQIFHLKNKGYLRLGFCALKLSFIRPTIARNCVFSLSVSGYSRTINHNQKEQNHKTCVYALRDWGSEGIQMDFRVLSSTAEGLNCPIAKRVIKCRIFVSGTPGVVTIKWQTKVAGWPVLETPCPGYGKNMEAVGSTECHTTLSRFTTAAHLLFTKFMATGPPSFPHPLQPKSAI